MKRNHTFLFALMALMMSLSVPLRMVGQTRETKTEGFENAVAGSNYQGTVNVTTSNSDCGIAWQIYYGNVSTSSAISGSNSAALRLYTSNNYGYLKTTTAIEGLSQVSFKAKAATSNSALIKVNISYSIDGSTWTNIETDKTLTSSAVTYTETIPSGGKYFQIAISSNSTKPSQKNAQLTIDDVVFTYTPSSTETYTVTYDCNGGTSDCPSNVTDVTSGTSITLADAPTRTDYTFDGWKAGNTTYQPGASYTVNSDVTFTAQWTEQSSGGDDTQTLTFDVTSNPGGWPTANSTTLTNYTYSLNGVNYTFALKNVKCNSGYLMLTATAVLGLPAIEGYKLTKVVANNSNGCSTSTIVGISSSATQASYIAGGEAQTWSTQGSQYTYNLTSTEANTMYYMYVTNKNAQIFTLKLTYEAVEAPTVATPTFDPANGTTFGNEGLSVTISCSTNDATIYYTLDGSTPDNQSTEYTGAIALTTTTTINAIAYDSDNNASNVATATYTFEDPNAPGTQNSPYTVAQAHAAIDASTGVTGVYATGIVSAIVTEYSTQYSNITFNFVDNYGDAVFLQAYRCKGSEAANVTVGDVVVVYGNLTTHDGTYEFGSGCQLISLTHPAVAAPTFTPAAGNYADDQIVTIACTTDGATIYYTTDGTEPTENSDVYSSPITVSLGTTTIKAIAVKEGVSSMVTTATYYIDPNMPGTELNPYTVAQALDFINNTLGSAESDTVYVYGIVSRVSNVDILQYHEADYYISDDGTTTSELMVYNGLYIYKEEFLSEDQIMEGDHVLVKGTLKNYNGNTPEFTRGNYIITLDRDLQPVFFNPGSCMLTSDNATVALSSDDVWTYYGECAIYYTTDGTDPRTSATRIQYDIDNFELITLTQSPTTLKAVLEHDGQFSGVTQAIYTIVEPGSPGLIETPFTVAEALAALDSNPNLYGVYVHGIISSISQIELDRYYNATYNMSDDGLTTSGQLQVYRGKYLYGEDFYSLDNIHEGDEILVYGDLTYYKGTTKEFKPKSQIWDLIRPTSIMIGQSNVEANCNETSGTLSVSYSNDILTACRRVQFYDANGNVLSNAPEWITVELSENTDWNLNFHLDANSGDESRTAYLRVMGCTSRDEIASNLVTILQNKYQPDFATLPFYYYGNEAETPSGITKDGMSTYHAHPYLKFENVDNHQDNMVLKFEGEPGILTYDIKATTNGKAYSGVFKVQASDDGINWTDMVVYETMSHQSIQHESIDNLPSTTRYIRWIYVTKSNGNVALGNIILNKPYREYAINLVQPYIEEVQVGTISCNGVTTAYPETTITLTATPYDGYSFIEWNVADVDGHAVEVNDNQFVMPYNDVNVEGVFVPVGMPFTYSYSVNGTVTSSETTVVGTEFTVADGENLNNTFQFAGWTTDPNDVDNLIEAGSTYRLMSDVTFYAVYADVSGNDSGNGNFVKVTRDLGTDWAGDYLIAYSDEIFADGRIGGTSGMGAVNASVSPGANLVGNVVAATWGNTYYVTLEEIENTNTYLLKTQDGEYNYQSSNVNGLSTTTNSATAAQYPISIVYVSENDIQLSLESGAVFRYNPSGFFRFYKNGGQNPVYLYKRDSDANARYTRVFLNETADEAITISGPSIIPSGSVLDMNGNTISNSLGVSKLLIAEGGQLVAGNAVNATMMKAITPYEGDNDNYYLVSSPVNNLNPRSANMTGNSFDLYYFAQEGDTDGNEWINYKAGNFNLETGKGYLYANNYGGYITMAGSMTATVNAMPLDNISGKEFAGWNLIGNPYPCNVTIDKPFYRLAQGGAALATVATANTVAIAPMEGVFVDSEDETVTFTKAPDTPITGRGNKVVNIKVVRNHGNNRVVEDNAIVRFDNGGLLGKLVLNNSNARVFVEQAGKEYAIVRAHGEGELPVSFKVAENGTYSLAVDIENLAVDYLHLIDNRTGADVDLLQTHEYTFNANVADYTSRFRLVFKADTSDGDSTGSETFAYFKGSEWVITGANADATLQVVDMMGRVVWSGDVSGNVSTNKMAQGVYVLRLIDGNNVRTQKIVVD